MTACEESGTAQQNEEPQMIGRLEEQTLMALVRAGPASHAAKVYDVLEESIPNPPQFASLFITLNRMADKGLVTAKKDDSTGRTLRLFTISGEGVRALNESATAFHRLGGNDFVLA